LFIAISLLLYVYLTWMFLFGYEREDKTPHSVEIMLDFPRNIRLGEIASEYVNPQVKVSNQAGDSIKGVEVKVEVVKVTTDAQKSK
jgi:hypothetical protein